MKKIIVLILISINTLMINAQALTQDTNKTTVTFKIKNFGSYVDGDFSEVTIESNFDKNNLSNSFINATIDVTTIDTDNATRNKSLSEKKYFDIANYKNITLTSTKIEKKSDNRYTLKGKLTIKKTTKEVSIPLMVSESGNKVIIQSDFEINRLDYNVGKKSWVMSKDVKIKVNYVASK